MELNSLCCLLVSRGDTSEVKRSQLANELFNFGDENRFELPVQFINI